ncbi:type I 3-dehydroquinate dehydratase [Vagococcus teuberi]
MISRVSGETFGLVLTFGSVQSASTPGQASVPELRDILTTIRIRLVKILL